MAFRGFSPLAPNLKPGVLRDSADAGPQTWHIHFFATIAGDPGKCLMQLQTFDIRLLSR